MEKLIKDSGFYEISNECNAYLISPLKADFDYMNKLHPTTQMIVEDMFSRRIFDYGQCYPVMESNKKHLDYFLVCRRPCGCLINRTWFVSALDNLCSSLNYLNMQTCFLGFRTSEEYESYHKDLESVFLFRDSLDTLFTICKILREN